MITFESHPDDALRGKVQAVHVLCANVLLICRIISRDCFIATPAAIYSKLDIAQLSEIKLTNA